MLAVKGRELAHDGQFSLAIKVLNAAVSAANSTPPSLELDIIMAGVWNDLGELMRMFEQILSRVFQLFGQY